MFEQKQSLCILWNVWEFISVYLACNQRCAVVLGSFNENQLTCRTKQLVWMRSSVKLGNHSTLLTSRTHPLWTVAEMLCQFTVTHENTSYTSQDCSALNPPSTQILTSTPLACGSGPLVSYWWQADRRVTTVWEADFLQQHHFQYVMCFVFNATSQTCPCSLLKQTVCYGWTVSYISYHFCIFVYRVVHFL